MTLLIVRYKLRYCFATFRENLQNTIFMSTISTNIWNLCVLQLSDKGGIHVNTNKTMWRRFAVDFCNNIGVNG